MRRWGTGSGLRRWGNRGRRAAVGDGTVTVRISNQMRAWFNGPWRLGERAWSRVGLVLGGCLAEFDVEAEGLELADVGAYLAVAVGPAVVPAGSEVGEPGAGI